MRHSHASLLMLFYLGSSSLLLAQDAPVAPATTDGSTVTPPTPVVETPIPPVRIGSKGSETVPDTAEKSGSRPKLKGDFLYYDQLYKKEKTQGGAETKKRQTYVGRVGNFSRKFVEVDVEGVAYRIPRRRLPQNLDLRPGENIRFSLGMSEIESYRKQR